MLVSVIIIIINKCYSLTVLSGLNIFSADMLNHSFEPNCFLHWRPKDRILEVMSNAGQAIKKGEEARDAKTIALSIAGFQV